MKKPVILITGGQAIDRQFHGKSWTLNKTYVAAISAAGGIPVMALDPDSLDAYVQMADGLLCSGTHEYSPEPGMLAYEEHEKRNEYEHRIMRKFIEAKKPILGVCLGLQQLNVVFGGTLLKKFRLTDGVEHAKCKHPLHTVEGSLLRRLFGTGFWVNSLHTIRIDTLAPCLRVAATSPDGVIEAFEHESLPILGCQFHPERMRGDFPEPSEAPDMTPLFVEFVRWCRTVEKT